MAHLVVYWFHTGQDRTGQDRTGHDTTVKLSKEVNSVNLKRLVCCMSQCTCVMIAKD